jgi:hypothetical protein
MRRILLPAAAAAVAATIVAGCGSSAKSGAPNTGGGAASATSATSATSAPPTGGPTASLPPEAESNPAGDIPDNQAFVAYSPAGGAFTVKVPEGWARTDTGKSTSFTDKLNRIEITQVSAQTPPSAASITADAFERYAFYRGGQEVDLTLSGPLHADNVDPWRIVSDSFGWR